MNLCLIKDIYSNLKISIVRNQCKIKRKKIALDNIKILFIVQRTDCFSSCETIYSTMTQNSAFHVDVLAIPTHIVSNGKIEFDKDSLDKTFLFCKSLPGNHQTFQSMGTSESDFNIENNTYDYVIINIPYENQYPPRLQFACLKRIGRLCYFPYGYNTANSDFLFFSTHPNSLMYYLDYYFVSNTKYYNKLLRKKMGLSQFLSRKAVLQDRGYPRFDNCKKLVSRSKFSVLWLPRWTTSLDLRNEQSSFIKYKDFMITLARCNPDIDVIIRPHPLMFNNFIKQEVLTESDIIEYKRIVDETENICLDKSTSYLEVINKADIVVSDFTGLLVEIFILKKKVIYTGTAEDFDREFHSMANTFYICQSSDEIEKVISNIRSGKDPKTEERNDALLDFWTFNKKTPTKCVMEFFMNNKK